VNPVGIPGAGADAAINLFAETSGTPETE
jgi:hypothetical protein